MVQMDESIRKQLEKPQTWFCKYFPKRIQNVGEKEIADRQLVYATLLSQLCHLVGTTVTLRWHNRANKVAQIHS